MKAMIFAAGLGTRLKPWTDHHPKALAIVNGKSLLQRNMEFLQKGGINEVIINVHHFAQQVTDMIEENKGWGMSVSISDESDGLLETGGGLRKAAGFFASESDFVLMNVDILTDLDLTAMIAKHKDTQPLATLAVTDRETARYFLFNGENVLAGWRNTKTGEEKISRNADTYYQKAFSGIHIINTAIFPKMQERGKISMVDIYLALAGDHTILSYDHSGGRLIDVGRPESITKAEILFP